MIPSNEINFSKVWTDFYLSRDPSKTYPNEYLVRVFLGNYPNLKLDRTLFSKQSLLYVSFGDARNLKFLADLGFQVTSTEISSEIISHTKKFFGEAHKNIQLEVAQNDALPFDSESFDYVVSWNVCYYVGKNKNFDKNISELARVVKPGGKLVISAPMISNFIFEQSEKLTDSGLRKICSDPFGLRTGEILQSFESEVQLLSHFQSYFENFRTASLVDDCFGNRNHYHIFVADRKTDES